MYVAYLYFIHLYIYSLINWYIKLIIKVLSFNKDKTQIMIFCVTFFNVYLIFKKKIN